MSGKVMVVDPVSTNRILLNVKLSMAFYDVCHSSSGAAARARCETDHPDLILLSEALPDMTSQDFCTWLKDDPRFSTIPIVVLSTKNDVHHRLDFLAAGADDILVKPIHDDVLLARLRSLVRARETERELLIRDDMNRALGFSEKLSICNTPAQVRLITQNTAEAEQFIHSISQISGHRFQVSHPTDVLASNGDKAGAEVYLIALSTSDTERDLQIMLELRTRAASRNAAVIVLVPNSRRSFAARALDLGANDLMIGKAHYRELAVRIDTQLRRKRGADLLRKNMRAGLRAAVIDPLTDLYNRRYALPYLSRVMRQAIETKRNFAVMVADIDHFKQINDRFGHILGDAVLTHIAHLLRDTLRAADLVARIGGEEFLIIMPDSNREAAHFAASRLCSVVAENPFYIERANLKVPSTISIGVTIGPDFNLGCDAQPESLLELADKALYGAKAQGRNQVNLAKTAA